MQKRSDNAVSAVTTSLRADDNGKYLSKQSGREERTLVGNTECLLERIIRVAKSKRGEA
jgi:hypothetical protein